MRDQRDLFISHENKDGKIAMQIAGALEAAGYTTWYYERDSVPLLSYLIQTMDAINDSQALVILISKQSVESNQVGIELVRAHESNKRIIPLLYGGITDAEYKTRQPEWKQMLGATTSLEIPGEEVQAIMPRVLKGLQRTGIMPGGQAVVSGIKNPDNESGTVETIEKKKDPQNKRGLLKKAGCTFTVAISLFLLSVPVVNFWVGNKGSNIGPPLTEIRSNSKQIQHIDPSNSTSPQNAGNTAKLPKSNMASGVQHNNVIQPTLTKTLTPQEKVAQAIAANMVLVEGGPFIMGFNSKLGPCPDNEKLHKVTLNSFYINKFDVTQEQWKALMGTEPSHNKNCLTCPVDSVSWNDAMAFIEKLNMITNKNYRLPTEAEWEYAERGGKKDSDYIYSGSNILDDVAWYDGNSAGRTHPVGQLKPNQLGLYDMTGNVWQWCFDAYSKFYYGISPVNNPKNTEIEITRMRVMRGINWHPKATNLPILCRHSALPDNRSGYAGFRLAESLTATKKTR